MSPENTTSGTGTGTTSQSAPAPRPPNKPAPANPKTDNADRGSEADFLARQAQEAKAAMSQTVSEMGKSLAHAVDVRLWTKDHPWAVMAAAAIGGFAAAAALVPSQHEQALNKLKKIEEALRLDRANRQEEKATEAAASKDGKKPPEKPGIMATLVREAFGMLKPIVASAIAAGVSAHVAQPQPDGQNPAQAAGTGAGFGTGGAG